MSALELRDVAVDYPVKGGENVLALSGVSLTIDNGEFVVALGQSGCGKTTLLNLIAGFMRPTHGQVTLGSEEIEGPGSARGVVFQKHALFPWLNVRDNVSFGLRLRGVDKRKSKETADFYLGLVGLEHFATRQIYELSGGMQQRVGLARALASDPEILLMDEPLGALDAFTRESMQKLVLEIWHETGKKIFFITHSVEEALFMSTRLVIMSPRPGRIIKEYPLDFSRQYCKTPDARKIKSMPEFIEMRERVLSLIHTEDSAK